MKNIILKSVHFFRIALKTKLIVLLLVISLLEIHATTYSQNTKFTLNMTNASVAQILNKIEALSEYRFLYESDRIDLNRRTTLVVRKKTISVILKKLFHGTDIVYKMRGRLILLTEKKKAAIAEQTIASANKKEQTLVVKGTVTDKNGTPLPGANVLQKGTTNGATTDFDGNFSITVTGKNAVLLISYMGFETKEIMVGDQTNLSISMKENTSGLDEVVVTALGVKKEKKRVGYAVQQVIGETMTKAREPNMMNSLTGKIAGLTIKNSSDLFQDSSISLRGQIPLVVIDGIPNTDNDFWKLNTDDIDEINVLKGATAAALYGSIGRGGALMITTKRGKEGKVKTRYNVSVMLQSNFIRIPKVQSAYGNGNHGTYEYVNGSGSGTEGGGWIWGPRLDLKYPGTPSGFWETKQFNSPIDPNTGQRIPLPFLSRGKDNVRNFFDTGMIATNNISFSGGSKNGNFRVSASHIYQKGIVPNTDLKNTSFGVSGGYHISDKLRTDASITYNRQYTQNFPETGYGPFNYLYNLVLWTGPDIDVRDLRNYWMKEQEGVQQRHFNRSWYNNPYFIAYEALQGYYKDNIYGQLNLSYEMSNNLSFVLRSGFNSSNLNRDWKRPKSFIRYGHISKGDYFLSNSNTFSLNTDFLASYNREMSENFDIKVNLGVSNRYWTKRSLSVNSDGLTIPGFYNLSNSINPLKGSNWNGEEQVNSVYGTLDFEVFKSMFLNITGRNDWVSTLPVENNSFFYPSLSLSVILSDLLDFNSTVPYVKIRSSWANVSDGRFPGVGFTTYNHLSAYNTGVSWNNLASLSYPNILPNPKLKPENSDTLEYGLDVRFFNNRLRLDATYYTILETNNIVKIPVSITSGYKYKLINGNEYKREGIELILSTTPLKMTNFSWNILTNWSSSHRRLKSVYDGSDRIGNIKVGTRTDQIYQIPYLKTPDGKLIYGSNGIPLRDTFSRKRGYSESDWVFGFYNKFAYKNVSLSISFDGRLGGLIYSTTNQKMWWGGTHPDTVNEHREAANKGEATYIGPGVVVVKGDVEYDAEGNIVKDTRVYAPNTTSVNYISWNQDTSNALLDHYYDQTFVKLREVILTYDFSEKLINKLGLHTASLSLVGRNLVLWSKLPNVDPDSGIDNLQTPSTRNIGFNMSLTF